MAAKNIVLGLMSGTSCDGLTLAAVHIKPFTVLAFENYMYTPALQQRLLYARELTVPQLSALHFELGKLYADKTKQFLHKYKIKSTSVICAGMHGQTVYHGPRDTVPNTLQIAEPSFLAEAISAPVVSNFRERDIVLGGQGAPLVPFFDAFMFGKGRPKILLNLGGIANLSVVGKNSKTYGFDCGPANTLTDLVCQKYLHLPFDKNGSRAAKGTPDKVLVARLLKQPFFLQKPPKSLDKNDFGPAYLQKYFKHFGPKRINDLLATLNYFTAAAAAQAIKQFVPANQQKEIIVSGGGVYNKTVLFYLHQITGLPVYPVEKYHLHPQAKEAAAFAVLAWLAVRHKTNHCPSATGARKQTVLGRITL